MKSGGGEVGKTSRFPRFLPDFPHVPPPSISFCILQSCNCCRGETINSEKNTQKQGKYKKEIENQGGGGGYVRLSE